MHSSCVQTGNITDTDIDCAILVMSCDSYEDLWLPFFTLFDRYWHDCPFPVYLGAEQKTWPSARVTTLRSSMGGRNWSGRLLDYLQQLRQTHIIILLDDFFLRKLVHTPNLYHCLRFARATDAIQVRLVPLPGPTVQIAGETILGECVEGYPYRLNTQASIWGRYKLMELLRTGESIWEFEHNGNLRVFERPHGFYAVRFPVLPYQGFWTHHVIEKGMWLPIEKWFFGKKNIGCNFGSRVTMPVGTAMIYQIVLIADKMLVILPWRVKKAFKISIKRLLIPIFGSKIAMMAGRYPVNKISECKK